MRARTRADWEAGIAAGVGSTPFQDWDWLHGQAQMHGWRCEPLLIRRGRDIVGAIPLLLQRRGPFWASASVPFAYAGPVVGDDDAHDAFRALRRWSSRHGVLVTRLDFLPGDRAAVDTALLKTNSALEKPNTFLLDLTGGVDGVRAQFTGRVRSSLKSAAKHDVTVADATQTEVETLLPALLSEAFAVRDQASPYPADIGSWAWQHLQNRPFIAKAAHVNRQPAGLLLALGQGRTMYLWAGGAFREFRQIRPSHTLHAAVFEAAAEQDYDQFDFMGEVDEGVNQFKMSFGAVPATFTMAQQTTYPLYNRLRDLRR